MRQFIELDESTLRSVLREIGEEREESGALRNPLSEHTSGYFTQWFGKDRTLIAKSYRYRKSTQCLLSTAFESYLPRGINRLRQKTSA